MLNATIIIDAVDYDNVATLTDNYYNGVIYTFKNIRVIFLVADHQFNLLTHTYSVHGPKHCYDSASSACVVSIPSICTVLCHVFMRCTSIKATSILGFETHNYRQDLL